MVQNPLSTVDLHLPGPHDQRDPGRKKKLGGKGLGVPFILMAEKKQGGPLFVHNRELYDGFLRKAAETWETSVPTSASPYQTGPSGGTPRTTTGWTSPTPSTNGTSGRAGSSLPRSRRMETLRTSFGGEDGAVTLSDEETDEYLEFVATGFSKGTADRGRFRVPRPDRARVRRPAPGRRRLLLRRASRLGERPHRDPRQEGRRPVGQGAPPGEAGSRGIGLSGGRGS